MKSRRIKTLAQLHRASVERRAVYAPQTMCFCRPMPAAFVINMNGSVLLNMMNAGLFVYPRKSDTK